MKTDKNNQPHKELLRIMSREIQNLNKMIEEFLSLSAPLSIRRESTNLSDFLKRQFEFAKILADRRNLELVINDEFDNKKALIDSEKLTRAIGNILKNAIEATPAAGKISLTGVLSEDKIVISIHNSGQAIPEEILPKLFKPVASHKSSGSVRIE